MLSPGEVDRHLYALVHNRWRWPWLDPAMIWCTRAGTKGIIWFGLAAGIVLDPHGAFRKAALVSITALLLSEGLINLVLKPVIRRERPFSRPGITRLLVTAPGPHSWPSAHAGSSAAAAAALVSVLGWEAVPFAVLALLIAYSRVYVGVHYPFDVAAGILVGCVCAAAVLTAVTVVPR